MTCMAFNLICIVFYAPFFFADKIDRFFFVPMYSVIGLLLYFFSLFFFEMCLWSMKSAFICLQLLYVSSSFVIELVAWNVFWIVPNESHTTIAHIYTKCRHSCDCKVNANFKRLCINWRMTLLTIEMLPTFYGSTVIKYKLRFMFSFQSLITKEKRRFELFVSMCQIFGAIIDTRRIFFLRLIMIDFGFDRLTNDAKKAVP